MVVKFDGAGLSQIRPHEYATRFLFGGAVTAVAGVIAKHYGASFGGLFLAFPAIFPASISLVAKKEKEKKSKAGFNGNERAKDAAGLDATGTALGCLGLMAFAAVVAYALESHGLAETLAVAMAAWFLVASLAWVVWKRGRLLLRRRLLSSEAGFRPHR
jgi:hypothetical protein